MAWTHKKIVSLAPNSLVLEKAASLSSPRRWALIASNGSLLWGECKSTGERNYRVVVRFGDDSFRCNCNSRYHPCRHILALLSYFVKNNDKPGFVESPPLWAQQLLKESPVKILTDEEKAQREAERSRRYGQRLELMEQGNRELEEWLLDLARQGLSAIDEQPPSFWDSFATRMVDSKMRGVSRRIRNFKTLAGKENSFELLLEEMAELYLLTQAFKQLESLPESLQDETLNQMGVNYKKEEILNQSGLADNWLAIGQVEGEAEEDNLRYRRTWFLGEKSSRLALLLDFSWGRQPYDTNWIVGSNIEGTLVFYPGAYPMRALFRTHQPNNQPFHGKSGYAAIGEFSQAYAQALSANPWIQSFPCLLAEVFPVQEAGQLWLVDTTGKMMRLSSESLARWNLLAVSNGRPIQAFGEWNGKVLTPLSATVGGRVISL